MSDQNEETSGIVIGIGEIILGSGILLAVWMLSPVPILELLQIALLIFLPIAGILAAVGLISHGSVRMIWNQQLADKVNGYVEQKRAATE